MAGFICKQPNGLYCRFSTIVDCPTHVNMTQEEFDQFLIDASTPIEELPTTNPENDPSEENLVQKLSKYILELKGARGLVITGRDDISYGKVEVLDRVIERLEGIVNS